MTMSYIKVLCFISLGFYSVVCAPVEPEKSLYDVIAEKCPSVHSLATYKDQQLFKTCKDWKTINEVDKLTENNKKDVLCLLYFESFTQYCTKASTLNTSVSKDVLIKYSVDMICDYVKTIPRKNLNNIFKIKDNCEKICTDNLGFVDSVCSISYYFAHEALTPVIKTEENKAPSKQILPSNDHQNEPPTSNAEETNEKKELYVESAQATKVDKPNNVESNKVPAKAPLQRDMVALDETKANPSKDLKNSADTAIGEVVPVNPQSAQSADDAPTADTADKQKATADTGAKPKAPAATDGAEAHLVKDEQNADNKVNEANPAPIENKPAETVDNPLKQDSNDLEDKVKPADTKDQGNNAENPSIHEAPDTDQEIQQENFEQGKGEQIPGSPELEDMDDGMSDGPEDDNPASVVKAPQSEKSSKPLKVDNSEPVSYATEMEGDSYFFTYFMLLCIIFIVGYVCYHNKQKILALILEGRKGKRQYRGRRPNSANYHKLDSNLEEAITSSCKKNTSNVIY